MRDQALNCPGEHSCWLFKADRMFAQPYLFGPVSPLMHSAGYCGILQSRTFACVLGRVGWLIDCRLHRSCLPVPSQYASAVQFDLLHLVFFGVQQRSIFCFLQWCNMIQTDLTVLLSWLRWNYHQSSSSSFESLTTCLSLGCTMNYSRPREERNICLWNSLTNNKSQRLTLWSSWIQTAVSHSKTSDSSRCTLNWRCE
jgi:hypothetical protein